MAARSATAYTEYSVPERSLLTVAARSGVVAAIGGVATAVVVAVLCWLPDAGVSGRPGSAIRAGLLSFLAAQHGGITVDGVHGYFVPGGMLIGVAIFVARAGRTIGESIEGPLSQARLVTALLVGAFAYAASTAVLVPFSRLGTSHGAAVTPVAAFVLFTVVGGAALLVVQPVPVAPRLAGIGRGALMATALYLAAGALLTAGSLIMHAHRVMQISREVGGGLSGLPVLVISLLCAPNAAIAGSAYLAGPGFAVGSGTTVNALSTSHGLLPALPVLGAVPDGHGANPVVLGLMSLVPLVAAVCVARAVRRAGSPRLLGRLGGAAASGALTGVLMAVAAWLGGGSAGTGRLRVVGASAWQVGLAVTAVVSILAMIAVLALAGWDRFAPVGAAGPDDEPAQARELATAATR